MKSRPCLSSDAMADLVRGTATEEDQRHSIECPTCARRVSLLRRIRSAGPGPLAEALDEVEELVTRLLAADRGIWWRVVKETDYRRPEVARRLLRLGVDARLRDRPLAVDLAKAATTIMDSLTGSVPQVADLRFEAWKFSSAVLREAGRYAETEVALVRADEAAQTASDPDLAQASVLLSRALLCAEPDYWSPQEAVALLDRVDSVFSKRDPVRMQAALTARAFLLFRSGDLRVAREKFAILVETTPRANPESYLDALSNLMWVCVELREQDAEIAQTIAFLINENLVLGRTVQVARARWMLGRVNVSRNEYEAAIDLLRSAMTAIGDSDSSIRVGVDTIEALLLAGRHREAFEFARELATTAVTLEQLEPSRRHQLTAQVFAYLREAAQRQVLTADLVCETARYIDRITRQRPFAFVPPMPLVDM
jgi:tetratricopeptide (TPR) repeat protein